MLLQPLLLSPHLPSLTSLSSPPTLYESAELTCHHHSRLVEAKETAPKFTAGEAFNVTARKILLGIVAITSSLWIAAYLA